VLLSHPIQTSRLEGLSIPYLAAMARMSPRSVNRALAVVADPDKAGVVVRHASRTKGDHGPYEVNAYEINLERLTWWERQERPKSWSPPRRDRRSDSDTTRADRVRAAAAAHGVDERDPEVAKALLVAQRTDRLHAVVRRAAEVDAARRAAAEVRAQRITALDSTVDALVTSLEARPLPSSAVTDAAPASAALESGERPLSTTAESSPVPASEPPPKAAPPIHQPAKTLEEIIAKEPTNELLRVLARGVADGHGWSISVAEYVVENGRLAEGHKATLRKRRDAYARTGATAAPSTLQKAPGNWKPRGTHMTPEDYAATEEDLDFGDVP